MQLGMIGLGRMGANMVRRLLKSGHDCVAYDMSAKVVAGLVGENAVGAASRAELAPKGIRYIDVGTSGGVWGLERGYCMMIGGETDAVQHWDPIFSTLAPGRGDLPRTPGREAANIGKRTDALDAETTPLREPEHYQYDLNLPDITELWRRGRVIASWLLDLSAAALIQDPALSNFAGRVSDSGEGRWTIKATIDEAVPAQVLSSALYERFSSRGEADFADRPLSAMRYEFGGHLEKPAKSAK